MKLTYLLVLPSQAGRQHIHYYVTLPRRRPHKTLYPSVRPSVCSSVHPVSTIYTKLASGRSFSLSTNMTLYMGNRENKSACQKVKVTENENVKKFAHRPIFVEYWNWNEDRITSNQDQNDQWPIFHTHSQIHGDLTSENASLVIFV